MDKRIKDKINSKMYYYRALEEINIAKKYESQITNNLKQLCKKHKGKLQGLNYKIKKHSKVINKLKLKGDNVELRDILRYSIVFETEKYTQGVYNIFTSMINNNKYNTKHKWVKQKWCMGDMYQGINTSWIYNNAFVFELQFHTEESFTNKTTGEAHSLYDRYNLNKCENIIINGKDYKKYKCRYLRDKMNELEDLIPVPPELEGNTCGYGIEEWYKLLNIKSKLKNKKKSKMRSKKHSKKRTKKRSK